MASSSVLSLPTLAAIGALAAVVGVWSGLVNSIVTEPYLDEVFHVGQAQKYLEGRFLEWDPKITTPPGLYALSTILARFTGLSSLASLRALNALLLPCLVVLIVDMETKLGTVKRPQERSAVLAHQLHTAFNVALFPPLFFFSALYYTDIASVVSVLLFWNHFLRVNQHGEPSILQHLQLIALGLFSLTFRQTNIFWVSIFPAAILLMSRIDDGFNDPERRSKPLLNPPVSDSYADDFVFCITSLLQRLLQVAFAIFSGNLAHLKLVRSLIPYGFILASFAAFVAWNGGVVLGDKSNHVATIHLAQLLYLWPYIMFFSFPLCYPHLLRGLSAIISSTPILSRLNIGVQPHRKAILPRPVILAIFITIAALIVHYNTIIHPFTLADNRHYMFYVFRRLTAFPGSKFLAVPLYPAAAWATLQALGAPPPATPDPQAGPHKSQPPGLLNAASAGAGAPVGFVLVWLGAAALQLVSAPLVEPRYFIVPWIMWRLRVPRVAPRAGVAAHDRRLWAETAWFLAVDAVTGYVFLYRGFGWPQEAGRVQRFMW